MRIDAAQLAVFDERGDHRPVVATFVRSGEQGVFAIEGQRPNAAFDDVAVEIDTAIAFYDFSAHGLVNTSISRDQLRPLLS